MEKRVELLKDIADIIFSIVGKELLPNDNKNWITAANLLPNNFISNIYPHKVKNYVGGIKIILGDIIVKRISPTYVNYIDVGWDRCYASNNLIIIRSKKVYDKYLAFILNENIEKFSKKISSGALMPTINRVDLENMIIPICDQKVQKLVGDLWYQSLVKKNLKQKLAELENKQEMILINSYLNKEENV